MMVSWSEFEFTLAKYGAIPGEVISVSNDAIEDESCGGSIAPHLFEKQPLNGMRPTCGPISKDVGDD